eukprot:4155745-Amphidinium_carterae.1
MLQAQHVSKQHARFHVRQSVDGIELTLTDTSSNGTWLNGQRLAQMRSMQVCIGDIVAFLPPSDIGTTTAQLVYKVFPAKAGNPHAQHSLKREVAVGGGDEMCQSSKRPRIGFQGKAPVITMPASKPFPRGSVAPTGDMQAIASDTSRLTPTKSL